MSAPVPADAVGPAPLRVTAWSLHLPGPQPAAPDVPEQLHGLFGTACPADAAATVLGRKGLLFKEPATRLALCAVHRALGHPDGRRPDHPLWTDTAVVACGMLGSIETVLGVVRTVRTEGVRAVSPLAAPNASSNVLASTVARWFGLGGPNLMITSGRSAGLDALAVADRLIRAGRARRVVLVGAEPDDEPAAALHAGKGRAPLRAGAACLVLEAGGPVLRDFRQKPELLLGPDGFDPARWGDRHGAQGVISLALGTVAVAAGRLGHVRVAADRPGPARRTATIRCGQDGSVLVAVGRR